MTEAVVTEPVAVEVPAEDEPAPTSRRRRAALSAPTVLFMAPEAEGEPPAKATRKARTQKAAEPAAFGCDEGVL